MSNDIEDLLRATIQTKVIDAFNQAPEAIDKLVAAALSKEVDENGMKPRYGGGMPFMEWLVGEEIRRAVREAVSAYVAEHKDEIAAKVQDAISRGDFGSEIGKTVAEIMAEDWRWSFSITTERER